MKGLAHRVVSAGVGPSGQDSCESCRDRGREPEEVAMQHVRKGELTGRRAA